MAGFLLMAWLSLPREKENQMITALPQAALEGLGTQKGRVQGTVQERRAALNLL